MREVKGEAFDGAASATTVSAGTDVVTAAVTSGTTDGVTAGGGRHSADAALAADVRRTLATTRVWDAAWAAEEEDPPLPRWLEEEDLAVYVDAFTRTGFTGGLNLYRNIDRNWELLAAVDGRTIDMPALFLTGTRDPVTRFMPHQAMDGHVTDLREVVLVEGAGHWVQQERPDEVNAALIAWLDGLDP